MSYSIIKNRERSEYTFANINLLGVCNCDCYFCLGKDIEEELKGKNQLVTHFHDWKNFKEFLSKCEKENIEKLYITGQTSDGLQYKYLSELINFLQNYYSFSVGIRSNGYLALQKLDSISLLKDEIGYSVNSLNPEKNKIIMGRSFIPDWDKIIPLSGNNVRASIVVNRYNVDEFFDIVKYLSKFENIRYIQARRISTDTRYEKLKEDIEIYENLFEKVLNDYKQIETFYFSQVFEIYGKKINFWRTVETSVNSLNYFTDGTISDEYFIVEGYLKSKNKVYGD